MKHWLIPLLAAAALVPAAAAAQRPIVPGELTRGSLDAGDPRLQDDTFFDDWVFEGRRGETVVVSMESRAFDAFVFLGTLRYGSFQEVARDDDGGNGTDARLEVRLPEDGTYVVRATSLRVASGPYTLSLVGGRAPSAWYEPPRAEPHRPDRGVPGGYLAPGRAVSGRLSAADPTLDNGAFFHLYRYAGRRGEELRATLRSDEFDAYLVLGTPGGRHGIETALARDDDGAGGRDAHLVFTLPYDGEYVIRVNSLLPAAGEYTLELQSSLGGYVPPPGGYDGGYGRDAVELPLVGRWGLTVPGVRVDQGDWSSVSRSASMGILTIDGTGAYVWEKNGRVVRGQLLATTPGRDAQPGARYYVINDGRDEFYLFLTAYRGERYLQLNGRATDLVVAYGYREGGVR